MVEQSRGWQGAVLKVMRAPEFTLTVTAVTYITPHYLRLSFSGGGLFRNREFHPTMWIRLWFPKGKQFQQRAYTIVNPDLVADTFDLEFTLHEGPAPSWAKSAKIGDNIVATVIGSKFSFPEPSPQGFIIVGDPASLPAINSLLSRVSEVEARVWLEYHNEDDKQIPVVVNEKISITWVPRVAKEQRIVSLLSDSAFDAKGYYGWVACDLKTTRAVSAVLRNQYNIERKSLKSTAYWMTDRSALQ
ncbi:MAG: siderophore-interacting protein [Mycobacteriaceae bacterium]